MNERERFLETVRFGKPDRPPYWEDLREATLNRWRSEGMPRNVNVTEFFGLDARISLPVNLGLLPRFEEKVLWEDDRYRIWIDSSGAKRKDFKVNLTPGFVTRTWLEFPVKAREDFLKVKERYNARDPKRYPKDWAKRAQSLRRRKVPLQTTIYGGFWWVRDLMGLTQLSLTLHREPDFFTEMVDFSVDFQLETLHRALDTIDLDFVFLSEDMAYKAGPMISPATTRRFLLPGYKRISKFLRDHGVASIIVDCDGNMESLIPVWMEAGFDGVHPCEAAAGVNPVEMRRKYPRLVLSGGIDKREISKSTEEIDKEIFSKVPPLVKTGGYLPHIDHGVPSDISFRNYLHYRQALRETCEKD